MIEQSSLLIGWKRWIMKFKFSCSVIFYAWTGNSIKLFSHKSCRTEKEPEKHNKNYCMNDLFCWTSALDNCSWLQLQLFKAKFFIWRREAGFVMFSRILIFASLAGIVLVPKISGCLLFLLDGLKHCSKTFLTGVSLCSSLHRQEK